MVEMIEKETLLQAYDTQLRTEAETADALSVTRLGPLYLATFSGGVGFVTYAGGSAAATAAGLVPEALTHFGKDPTISEVEWKTRGHDDVPGLHEALIAAEFEPEEPESIMLGEAALLAGETPLPTGVTLRRISAEDDVRAMAAMQDEAFGRATSARMVEEMLRRLAADGDVQLWIAEAAGRIVSAGRLELVAGTDFAGIWGGSTLKEWRHRGIYRALTAARARAALAVGKRYVQSDSTELSRPILERSGLVKVSTTTPYVWRRP